MQAQIHIYLIAMAAPQHTLQRSKPSSKIKKSEYLSHDP